MNSNLIVIGKTTADNDKEEYDNEADDDDADNADESEGEEFEQETGWDKKKIKKKNLWVAVFLVLKFRCSILELNVEWGFWRYIQFDQRFIFVWMWDKDKNICENKYKKAFK